MNILPCNIISALPSLEILDLSNNLLKEAGFWWFPCMQTSVFPKLRQLYLAHNRFVSLSVISKNTHRMKALTSLDLSSNSITIDQMCSWPTHLTELSLSNLGNSIFEYLSPHFRHLDLSKTGITRIPQDVFQKFAKLTHLLLSSNGIQFIAENLNAPALTSLYVDQNAITSISMNSFKGLPNLQILMTGNNPFTCTCDSYWFVNGLNKVLLPDWPLDYICSAPSSLANLPLSDFKMSKLSCNLWLQAAIALPVTLAITVAFGVIFHVCDGVWYAKMIWVWIRVKRRGQKRAARLLDVCFQYNAFISYSEQDSSWVSRQLVPSLEGAGLHLCIHERDFVPGEWIMDNIINCVEASYKTLFVFSNNFVRSEWCNYELFFAQHRAVSIQDDSLVFILLEPIPTDSVPKKFMMLQHLLKQQTYLEWPMDELKQQLFWKSLRSMLQSADKHMALKEVALALSDTLPQL
ncbi:toll-like receptor 1 [Aplochiton taeniatus]